MKSLSNGEILSGNFLLFAGANNFLKAGTFSSNNNLLRVINGSY
jgi:hypothetical protein